MGDLWCRERRWEVRKVALLMDCTCVTKLPALPGSHSETSGMSVLRVDVCPLTSAGHPLDAFRGASEGFQLIRITKFLKKKKNTRANITTITICRKCCLQQGNGKTLLLAFMIKASSARGLSQHLPLRPSCPPSGRSG